VKDLAAPDFIYLSLKSGIWASVFEKQKQVDYELWPEGDPFAAPFPRDTCEFVIQEA
jgi:hypothetical protein